jgi:hypothetical protein
VAGCGGLAHPSPGGFRGSHRSWFAPGVIVIVVVFGVRHEGHQNDQKANGAQEDG